MLLPVIGRELRASARQPFTYTLRLLAVLALLMVALWFTFHGQLAVGLGGELFGALHLVFFCAIWVLVPLLCADCISRERREGTLPLLFLTPLRPSTIVSAKALAHGLRALSLWLAVVPVLTICLVAGGVDWAEVMVSALVNLSALVLALGAGVVASARTRVWARSLVIAFTLSLLLCIGLVLAFSWVASWAGGRRTRLYFSQWGWTGFGFAVQLALNRQVWQEWLSFQRSGVSPILWTFGLTALLSILVALFLLQFAGWNVKHTWREQPPSPFIRWLQDKLFRPVLFQHWLKRWLSWELHRNPIGWLEQRSWSGRLVLWSWFAVMVCVYSSLFANLSLYQRVFHQAQCFLAWLLAGSMALSAAGSFRRERETGVLELLLVAPLRESQIILGRLRGLWTQFLPAVVLLCAVWLYCATFLTSAREFPSVLFYIVTFATLPVVGLYFSLAKSNFIAAFLWTLAVQVLVPALLVAALSYLYYPALAGYNAEEGDPAELVRAGLQAGIALVVFWRLHATLKSRRFALTAKSG